MGYLAWEKSRAGKRGAKLRKVVKEAEKFWETQEGISCWHFIVKKAYDLYPNNINCRIEFLNFGMTQRKNRRNAA